MKQKYKLIKDGKNKQFVIQEYSEVDGEMPILLCEETYKLEKLTNALELTNTPKKKVSLLTKILRTHNIYPPSSHMSHIIDAALNMLNANNDQTVEVEVKINDKEISVKDSTSDRDKEENKTGKNRENSLDIDKLLKADPDKKIIKNQKKL